MLILVFLVLKVGVDSPSSDVLSRGILESGMIEFCFSCIASMFTLGQLEITVSKLGLLSHFLIYIYVPGGSHRRKLILMVHWNFILF